MRALLILLAICLSQNLSFQQNAVAQQWKPIHAKLSIHPIFQRLIHSEEVPSLGGIDAGQKVRLTVALHNQTSFPVELDALYSWSSQMKLDLSPLPPGQTTQLHYDWTAPNRAHSSEGYLSIPLLINDQSIHMSLKYQLQNYLEMNIPYAQLILKPDTPVQSIQLPMRVVAPLTDKDLRIQVDDTLRDLPMEMEHVADDQFQLTVSASQADVMHGSISGRIHFKNRKGELLHSTILVVSRKTVYQIQPETLRFQPDRSDSRKWVASVMIAAQTKDVEDAKEEQASDDNSESATSSPTPDAAQPDPSSSFAPLQISASLDGQPLEWKVHHLAPGQHLYRVDLQWNRPEVPADILPLEWQLTDHQSHSLKTRAFFATDLESKPKDPSEESETFARQREAWEKSNAAGLIAASTMEGRHWQKVDYLMQIVEHGEGPLSLRFKPDEVDDSVQATLVREKWIRVIQDKPEGKAFILGSEATEVCLRDQDGRVLHYRRLPIDGSYFSRRNNTRRFANPELPIPDLSQAGLFGLLNSWNTTDFARERFCSADEIQSVVHQSASTLKLRHCLASAPTYQLEIDILYDKERLNPQSKTHYRINPDSGRESTNLQHSVEWKRNPDGMRIPVRLSQDSKTIQSLPGSVAKGQQFVMGFKTEVVVHWFSLNQPITEPTMNADNDALRRLLDPEVTHATELQTHRLEVPWQFDEKSPPQIAPPRSPKVRNTAG